MPVPLIRLVAGTAELVRLPFPVATDQLRQLRLDNIGPLDLIPTRFGFEPRPMEGALGYLRAKPRDQVVQPGMSRDPGSAREPTSAAGSSARVVWLAIIVVIALGAAGLVDRHGPPAGHRPAGPS